MKIILLFLLSMNAAAQTKVTLTWKSGNIGAAKLPQCTYIAQNCVYGFTLKMDGYKIAGPAKLGIFATTYTQTPLPKKGNHWYSIVMNGRDSKNNPTVSKAATKLIYIP